MVSHGAISIRRGVAVVLTITEARRTLADQAKRREENQVVIESHTVAAETFRPEAQGGAYRGGDDGDRVDPVDLVEAVLMLVGLEVGKLLWREWRSHVSSPLESFAGGVEPEQAAWRRGRGWSADQRFT